MIGTQFGRWTVVGEAITTEKGEQKWLCRCSCGTERYVLERSLRYGGSTSCGCLRREEVSKARSKDLLGKTFGKLTVIGPAEGKKNRQGLLWRCRCSCGTECILPGTLLTTGRRTSCSSHVHWKDSNVKDISGMKFHELTALYPTQQRDNRGFVIWHCRCDCGNELDISYNALCYSNLKSCGCRKKAHNKKLSGYLIHEGGTTINMIRSKKIPANNTTGVKGVYLIRGQYVAKIVFQKKPYYLGRFDQIEDAVQARKRAESILFEEVSEYYDLYHAAAARDAVWAENHPMQIQVTQREDKELCVSFSPELSMVMERLHQGAAD